MLLIQALEFIIHRIDARIRKHLEQMALAISTTPEEALANHLKFQDTGLTVLPFDPTFSEKEQTTTQVVVPEPQLDDIDLQFGMKWKPFMDQSLDDFSAILKNGLKEKPIAVNKLLILVRFKRQLMAVSLEAKTELLRREEVCQKSKEKPSFSYVVDDKIVDKIKSSAAEAQKLASIALENGKLVQTIPFTSKKIEVNFNGPGRTEVTIMACEQALLKLRACCQDQDKVRNKAVSDPAAMTDVFPSALKANQVLTGLNQIGCQDLIERLFVEAELTAYQHFQLSIPARLKGFPIEASEQTRKLICEELRNFDEKTTGLAADSQEYWSKLFDEVDEFGKRLAPYKTFSPQAYLHKQGGTITRENEIVQRLHEWVGQKAQLEAPAAVVAHQAKCRLA